VPVPVSLWSLGLEAGVNDTLIHTTITHPQQHV
jgi:hypothetical protein